MLRCTDDGAQQRVAHELTRKFRHLVTGGNVFKLIVCIVAVTIEKFSIECSHFLAFFIHHSYENIGIVLVLVFLVPIFRVWIELPPLTL